MIDTESFIIGVICGTIGSIIYEVITYCYSIIKSKRRNEIKEQIAADKRRNELLKDLKAIGQYTPNMKVTDDLNILSTYYGKEK